ncbi:MAG: hypothetical protein ACOC22_00900 [bacterium]
MNKNIITPEERLTYSLILKYTMRYNQILNDLLHGGYMGVLAHEQVYDVVSKEFFDENPDVDKKTISKVFFGLGKLSGLMKPDIKSNTSKLSFSSDLDKFIEKELESIGIRKNIINKS